MKTDGPETRIEAGADRWYWGTPLPGGLWNVAAVVAPTCLKGGGLSLEGVYRRLVSESVLLRHVLRGRLTTAVRACNASSVAECAACGGGLVSG